MESNYKDYDYLKSISRIDTILEQQDSSFEELNTIPVSSALTYNNGFYVNATAVFVDIRNSSKLISTHKRPTLAKIYRSFISETLAILNSDINCKFLNVEGDCVNAIFDTPNKRDIDSVISNAARVQSLIKILNCKLKKKNISQISVGIGIDYGRLLMIKAGYSGSGLNDIVWMGEALNIAAKICNNANKSIYPSILISSVIFNNPNC